MSVDGQNKQVRFPGVVPAIGHAPGLGADTDAILGGLLGLGTEPRARLRAEGVV